MQFRSLSAILPSCRYPFAPATSIGNGVATRPACIMQPALTIFLFFSTLAIFLVDLLIHWRVPSSPISLGNEEEREIETKLRVLARSVR